MNKIILLILLTVSTNVFADSEGFYNGEKLITDIRSSHQGDNIYANGYILGVSDSNNELCIEGVVTGNQVTQITKNFLEKHPESWKYTASSLVMAALKEVYPCKK